MKNIRVLERVAVIFGIVLGLHIASSSASAQNLGNPGVVPPNTSEFGNTYGEWSARWWQWLLSIPQSTNPNLDTTGAHCGEAQTGQVWFLAGTFGGPAVTRSCTIPADKDLLLSPRNAIFGEGVGDCTGSSDCDPTVLRASAAEDVDNPTIHVKVDHVALKNLDQYRVTSPVFSVFFPTGAVFDLEPGTHSPVVSDGFWVLLKPLSRGFHTIEVGSSAVPGGPVVFGVTWHLTVN